MLTSSMNYVRAGFLCPECHQDMSTMETLQVHYQTVHSKSNLSNTTGIFSMAKQKLKSLKSSSGENNRAYEKYFHQPKTERKQSIGYLRAYDIYFRQIRKSRLEQFNIHANERLSRLNQLILIDAQLLQPNKANERQKFERSIVRWIDESVSSKCSGCQRSFYFYNRKHHCRLDGSVVCQSCSYFISFTIAGYLTNPHGLSMNDGTLQHFIGEGSVSSTVPADERSLRMCSSCNHTLKQLYKRLRFERIERDPVVVQYEAIAETRDRFDKILNDSETMDRTLLHSQIMDYRQVINSKSEWISNYPESNFNLNQDDQAYQLRMKALCRNIRTYTIELLRNYAIKIKYILELNE